ncbi:MAG: RagB/SusD family nutrient uptake outer membrane protein [Cyclobacteriaceae bacterium]
MHLYIQKTRVVLLTGILLLTVSACESLLEEDVFIDIASNNFWQNDDDAVKGVNAIYAKLRADGSVTGGGGQQEGWGGFGYGQTSVFNFSQVQTDELFIKWSNFDGFANFALTPSSYGSFADLFGDMFEGIFISNNVIINVKDNSNLSEPMRNRILGEAYFGRALFYSKALSLYGNIPLITEPNPDPLDLPEQADPAAIAQLVVDDLTEAAHLLPETYPSEDYGRFTKGAAYALLARFQLNQKNWSGSIAAAREVFNLGYELSSVYSDIFAVENQANPEIILTIPCIAQPGIGNTMLAHTAEPDYVTGSWGGHLAQDAFYNTFDPADMRRAQLLKTYTNVAGEVKTIAEGAIIAKYATDDNRVGANAGNDIVLHRLGEVYLTLAEALNEENGPNQESIDLINALRDRAFDDDPTKRIQLSEFASKEELRSHILDERSWELYAENYRREDLIRHGEYISRANARGIDAAQPHHVLYPIPQVEIDLNPKFSQNPGY